MRWPNSIGIALQPYDEAQDTVSGFKGKVTAEYRYGNGCLRYELSGADKEGKPVSYVFDEEQLKLIKRAPAPVTATRTGGARGTTPASR